ncbi:MAG: bifunctional 5,10-methylenetetrahydrofolate dehydrogenase/5,10-methenyltetrahydrofolate cyclohydrolase [Chloroflexota bacterium]
MLGRPVADAIWIDVERRAASLTAGGAPVPCLAIVEAADDPASAAYLRQIQRAFERHGLTTVRRQPERVDQAALDTLLTELAADTSVHAILMTQPLPTPLDLARALEHLPATKDVEGVHPVNAGTLAQGRPSVVPSTPLAGMEILKHAGVRLTGAHAVVVGRSPIVGRPLIQLLLSEHATVTVCHTRTADLGAVTRQADVLLLAAGRAGLVNGAMVKPGAIVIDFGINVVDDKLVGDADYESVNEVASAITPVPGGVGPVTTAVLARNLIELAEHTRRH